MSNRKLEISICMGSSCHSRGNSKNLEIIQSFIEKNNTTAEISLKGNLCLNECNKGPVITINGQNHFKVSPEAVEELLKHHLKGESSEQQ